MTANIPPGGERLVDPVEELDSVVSGQVVEKVEAQHGVVPAAQVVCRRVPVPVLDNAEYGAMKGFKTLFGINQFTDAIETALVALAQSMGVAAMRPHDPATLSDTLVAALASPAPILIDVPVAALRGVGPV